MSVLPEIGLCTVGKETFDFWIMSQKDPGIPLMMFLLLETICPMTKPTQKDTTQEQ